MFIDIMSAVIGEATRQPGATSDTSGKAPSSPRRAPRGRQRVRTARHASSAAHAMSALPGRYRVLAESFRRAAGFSF